MSCRPRPTRARLPARGAAACRRQQRTTAREGRSSHHHDARGRAQEKNERADADSRELVDASLEDITT